MVAPLQTQLGTILHGENALGEMPEAIRNLGIDRLLVLCGSSAARGKLLPKVLELLGPACVEVYSGCRAHTPIESVNEVVALARSKGIRGFVTIGGGSTVDTAKVAAAILGEGQPAEELITEFRPPDTYIERYLRKPKPPIIAIPCTLSGAETGPRAGFISQDRIKRIVGGDFMAARVLVLDAAATLDVDDDVFVRSGMNGLAHSIEGLYSKRRNPFATALALESIRLFVENLPLVKERQGDLQPRRQLLYAAYMGGLVLLNSRMGIHHAVCHCLGGRLGLSHGTVNSIMLPYSMRFNLQAAAPDLARAARAMGVPERDGDVLATARAGIDLVFGIRERMGVPNTLRELPQPPSEEDLDFVINDVKIERGLYFNPRAIASRADIAEIVRSAY